MFQRTLMSGIALTASVLVLFAGIQTMPDTPTSQPDARASDVHYMEIVCADVNGTCSTLESIHGVTFGEPVPAMGMARVAKMPNGSQIGVRGPMAAHETPIIRSYLAVDDIGKALKDAHAAGAVIAYGPAKQADTGTWAIYIQNDIQYGLWQK